MVLIHTQDNYTIVQITKTRGEKGTMENLLLNTMDKLETIERKYGMIGTAIGIALILIILAGIIAGIYALVVTGSHAIDWVLREFFGIKLF